MTRGGARTLLLLGRHSLLLVRRGYLRGYCVMLSGSSDSRGAGPPLLLKQPLRQRPPGAAMIPVLSSPRSQQGVGGRRRARPAAAGATIAAAVAVALLSSRAALGFQPPSPQRPLGPLRAPPPTVAVAGARAGRTVPSCGWRAVGSRRLHSSSGSSNRGGDGTSLPPGPAEPCTIPSCLAWATEAFTAAGVPDPALSAEYLLLHALGQPASAPRAALLAPPLRDAAVSGDALAAFRALCARRALGREPVQYLVGRWDFHRIALEVAPPTLIPRPETEELVEWVLQEVVMAARKRAEVEAGEGRGGLRFFDVGSGTGAIGLALLKALPPSLAAHSVCVGLDPHPAAVALARRNAAALGLGEAQYRVVQGRVEEAATIEAVLAAAAAGGGGARAFDFIVSNPPYIPAPDMDGLQAEVKAWEDRGALVGGADGTDIIRSILDAAPRLLRPRAEGGLGRVWMEVDVSHPALFEREQQQRQQQQQQSSSSGGDGGRVRLAEWRRDLAGNPRFCCWELD